MSPKKNKKIARGGVSVPWTSSKLALIAGTGLMLSGCAAPKPAPELSNPLLLKLDERDKKIAERDKVIDDLTRRMQALERHLAISQASQPVKEPIAAARASTPEKSTPTSSANQQQARNTTDTLPVKAGPGSFEVDENAAQRALERTLVQTGALLLPPGLAELQPYVTYTRRESKDSILVPPVFENVSVRRNEFDIGAKLLVGLPFESQAEFRFPYRSVNQDFIVSNGINSREVYNKTGNSLGDISVALAKTLLHETDWLPDLIGRVTYDSSSGSITSNNVPMGIGFDDFIGSFTALKRQDPLAFTATIAYQTSLKKNGIKPGDQASLTVGATLAASPQTSLSFGLQQTYAQATRINDVKIQGSDTVSSSFTLGAASTIGHNLFFSVLGGIGLTKSAPDYFFNVVVPIRFDVPYKFTSNKPK